MAEPVLTSQRFTKAARAERDRLARRRARLLKKREDLQAKVDALDEELEAVNWEIGTIESFALKSLKPEQTDPDPPEDDSDPTVLKGAAIRKLAVPLLMREQSSAPIHYRDWLALLNREGYKVAGKRPDAVFLNQVVRSPLVRASTQAGFYLLDLEAVDRLCERLRQQQSELASFIGQIPSDIEGLAEGRERQAQLSTAIAKTERELDEALGALEAGQQARDTEIEVRQIKAA